MALVKFGSTITDARGSIGGVTFSKGPGGGQMKTKPKPSRRVRWTQPVNRAILGYLSRAWGKLTAAQRTAWNDWALTHPGVDRFGDPMQLSGFNCFVKLNHPANRLGAIATYNAEPPVANLDKGMASLVASDGIATGEIKLSWTHNGVGIAADYNESAYAGPFTSPGREQVTNYKFADTVAGNLLTYTIADLIAGCWYWVRTRYVQADGQVSAWLYDHWEAPTI